MYFSHFGSFWNDISIAFLSQADSQKGKESIDIHASTSEGKNNIDYQCCD